ncbi:hypothetical protein EPA93_05730 [Ktedonosporobacter rubrisoli]|uniref:Manganese efflux pump MntP n=1 Tax=Ktedonosporobacter rubrisoli TaxID=2509675 RepID=A0A4P6JK62_KTERU|nr:manganese efflux pump [Ktedonosporobacter rubrisoli]QBD75529.1 hypothetical protein EPA93_05730 [Ktedonosporobacter rubrisoli]
MIALLLLGFFLSLDNFRVSIALGAFQFKWSRALRTAAVFGFWDGISPLIGALIGHYLGQVIGPLADIAGPIVLAGYGIFLIVRSLLTRITEEPEPNEGIVLLGMPLSLSLDNMIAGTGLGLFGFSPLFSAVVFGAITFLMSLIGLQLGKFIARFIPVRINLIAGIALLTVAIWLGVPALLGGN